MALMNFSRFTALRSIALLAALATSLAAAQVPMTLRDFEVPGTQVGDVHRNVLLAPSNCSLCHGFYDNDNEPFATWSGSLMAHTGRDPLFFAQLATANQDVANVGYYCLRCHVPQSIITGHAYQVDGSTLDAQDRRGVDCHFCHSMVDPIYTPGSSPPQDQAILAGLSSVPAFFGNAMFVIDPTGTRRGPYEDAAAPHAFLRSPFHRRSEFCGTCHDVGNVAVSRQPDGSYRYNTFDEPSPSSDPWAQFPLERTYTEWKLSAFANGGVDMGGRFGGPGATVVSSCQDCHMPRTTAQGCFFGPERNDLAQHTFAGAADWVLQIIGLHYADDPEVEPERIAEGRARAVSMLQRAATLELTQHAATLQTRLINQTGHKLPTGHIEGRRVWVNVKFFDASGTLLREHGHYDIETAELDEASTEVHEMVIGLSPEAAQATGQPPGPTTHMSLADTIVKDNRIPPRGFSNAMYEAGGAPAVDANFADGQYWADNYFAIPAGATRVEATAYYQIVTRHYIESLRDGNHTNSWGEILHDLWVSTNKAAPTAMHAVALDLTPLLRGDMNCDGRVNNFDIDAFVLALIDADAYVAAYPDCDHSNADVNEDGYVNNFDIDAFVECLSAGC